MFFLLENGVVSYYFFNLHDFTLEIIIKQWIFDVQQQLTNFHSLTDIKIFPFSYHKSETSKFICSSFQSFLCRNVFVKCFLFLRFTLSFHITNLKNIYKNISENYDLQTVVSFKTCQNISKKVKSWVLIDNVT